MVTPQKLTLRKSERLKSKKTIERLFKEGRSFFVYPFKVVYGMHHSSNSRDLLQAGFGVSSRNFRNAHDRNRLKRLTREAYRLQKHPLQALLLETSVHLDVFFIYSSRQIESYQLVSSKIDVILKKLLAEVSK